MKTDRELLEQIAQDVQEIKAQQAVDESWRRSFWTAIKSAVGQFFGEMNVRQPEQKKHEEKK